MRPDLPSWDEVIGRYGLRMRRAGRSLRGPCPLHGGRNLTAFVITPGVGFYCHACGAGGGVRDFLRRMGDRTFDDAAPEHARPTWSASSRSTLPRRDVAPQAPVRVIGPFDPEHPAVRARGIDPSLAAIFGCGYYRGPGPLHNRIVVPVHDDIGIIVGYIGRTVGAVEPRYMMTTGLPKSRILYNAHRARQSAPTRIIVVEGVFDAMAVHAAGFPNVVALLGCVASRTQLALLREPQVRILFDRDRAGVTAARALAAQIGDRATVIELPATDPATLRPELLAALLNTR